MQFDVREGSDSDIGDDDEQQRHGDITTTPAAAAATGAGHSSQPADTCWSGYWRRGWASPWCLVVARVAVPPVPLQP